MGGIRLEERKVYVVDALRKPRARLAARRDEDQPGSNAVAGSGCSATIPDMRQRISGPTWGRGSPKGSFCIIHGSTNGALAIKMSRLQLAMRFAAPRAAGASPPSAATMRVSIPS